jgi:transposase-like protein
MRRSRPEIGWYFGNEKTEVTMSVIRYSKGFKIQLVREVEAGKASAGALQRKYDIKGGATVMRWVRQLGSGRYGKIIRVEQADEVNEASRLRAELRRAKEALADTHMALALEQAFLVVACEEMDQSVEAFKKKHAGGRRTRRSRPIRG